jgi:ribulose-5-phosphate 4-epimerase/fuculose-1-phosphate aldolase
VKSSSKLAVFFFTHVTEPLRQSDIWDTLKPLGSRWLQLAKRNVQNLTKRFPGLKVITIRELLAGIENQVQQDVLKLFKQTKTLQQLGSRSPMPPQDGTPRYQGKFPLKIKLQDAQRMFAAMGLMQDMAAEILKRGWALSSSHIVLSAWFDQTMVITASNTDKHAVQLYSQTPIVQRQQQRWIYFGDKAFRPSTEMVCHWYIHAMLQKGKKMPFQALVHFHHQGLREVGQVHRVWCHNNIRIPCVAPETYGSQQMGEIMASAFEKQQVRAVTVANHGTWFLGSSLSAAFAQAEKTLKGVKPLTLPSTRW